MHRLCAERARAPRNARVFFEVVIERCVGVVQLGWIGTVVRCDQESGDGVGDDGVTAVWKSISELDYCGNLREPPRSSRRTYGDDVDSARRLKF